MKRSRLGRRCHVVTLRSWGHRWNLFLVAAALVLWKTVRWNSSSGCRRRHRNQIPLSWILHYGYFHGRIVKQLIGAGRYGRWLLCWHLFLAESSRRALPLVWFLNPVLGWLCLVLDRNRQGCLLVFQRPLSLVHCWTVIA